MTKLLINDYLVFHHEKFKLLLNNNLNCNDYFVMGKLVVNARIRFSKTNS